VPERAMVLSTMPVMQPLPPVPMPQQYVQSMRDWAQTFGAAVRQQSVEQETTMARAGTLPFYFYQRGVQPGELVSLEHFVLEEQQETETEVEEGIPEYDSSSNDEDLEERDNDEADDDIGSLDCETNFLLGTVSRFGRTIRFNNRIVF